MSVVAWDGKTLATDKQATTFGTKYTSVKSRKLSSGEVVAWTGNYSQGLLLATWYEQGADPEKWPEFQKTDSWTRLIVASKKGLKVYGKEPVAMEFFDAFQAWGAGMDYALGAMAMGANAEKAVEVACRFCDECGMGIDVYELNMIEEE